MAPASSRLRPLDNSVSTPSDTVASNRVFASASVLDAAGGLPLSIPSTAGDDAEDGAIFLLMETGLCCSSTLFLLGVPAVVVFLPFPNCKLPADSGSVASVAVPTFAVTHGAALGGRDPDRTLLNSAYQPFVLFVVELMGNMWGMR